MTQFQNQALREGVHIGVYEIKGILGATRYAITYSGWNHHLNAKVVLKEYFPHDYAVRREEGRIVAPKAENDREIYEYGLASFVEQADILGQIQQPSVVGVHNALQINGTAYLIMDYEDGVPLPMLSDPPPSLTGPKFKAILTSLLAGLEQVHACGTVHGDIHPSNILLRGNGEAVLIDFAAARIAMAERSNTLAQDLRAGYTAPERYDTGNRLGPESDLYALGATMYRCITHDEPAPAPERISALGKSEADPLKPLLGSGAPIDNEDLLKTIDWMLRLEAKDRPRSATDILAALSTEDEDVQQMRKQTESGDQGHMAKPVESPPRTALLVGGVIAFAALVAAGLWYFQPSEPALDTLTFKPNSGTAPLVSKAEDADATSEPVPFTDAEVAVAESPGETKSAPVVGNAQRETPSRDQGPAETEKTPPVDSVAKAPPSPQLPSTPEPAETSTPGAVSEPVTSIAAATPTKKTIEAAQPPSEAVAAVQPDERSTTRPVAGDGTIESQLAAAEEAIAALRLTTPEENNAYRHYQAVLAVDPGNAEARAGIERIVDLYVWLIEKAMAERRPHRAAIYLDRAEAIAPDAPGLRRLRTELNRARG